MKGLTFQTPVPSFFLPAQYEGYQEIQTLKLNNGSFSKRHRFWMSAYTSSGANLYKNTQQSRFQIGQQLPWCTFDDEM